jgi:hypothetical protein
MTCGFCVGASSDPNLREGGTMHPIYPALPVIVMGLAVLGDLIHRSKINFSVKIRWRRRRR